MAVTKRKPTGTPPYPIILLTGGPGAGKSFAAAMASASPRIADTFWLSVGEPDPDEYGSFGRFDIIEHENTLQSQLATLADIVSEPPAESGLANLLVIDSMTPWWMQVGSHAQHVANARASERTKKQHVDAPITSDLWSRSNAYWAHVMLAIRAFPGPVILTARLEATTVFENGQATADRDDKIKSQKALPYDVDVVVEMPERGETYLAAARSASLLLERRTRLDDFTVDDLWTRLDFDRAGVRRVSAPTPAPEDSFVFGSGS